MNPDSVSVLMTTAHVRSRRTGQRSDPAFIVERHTAIPRCDSVGSNFLRDTRSSLIGPSRHFDSSQVYVDDILTPIVLPMLSSRPGAIYQQDNARPRSPNNVFKDMTSYHGLPGHQIFRQ
ncbi:hypothetical protein TNCV_4642581 [Trichonephila clavipes]|nr:hypothetical protein TNCV_4642581 [Trichonephila clavipes]